MAAVSPIRADQGPKLPGQDAPAPAPEKKRRRAPLVFAGLVIVAGGVAALLYATRLGKEKTDDASVEGHASNVSARIAGQVKQVLVEDNQDVKPGDEHLLDLAGDA